MNFHFFLSVPWYWEDCNKYTCGYDYGKVFIERIVDVFFNEVDTAWAASNK